MTGPAGPAGPAGPQGADVPPIRVVTVVSTTQSAVASCAVTEALMTGGGSCSNGTLASSQQAGSTWTASCATGNAIAVALCVPNH